MWNKMFWRKHTFLLLASMLFVSVAVTGCASSTTTTFTSATTSSTTSASVPATTLMEEPYLGQKLPGSEPEIFAPGIVSDASFFEYCGTFSPDGSEYYFYRFYEDTPSRILFTRIDGSKWTFPEPCPFSEGYSAGEPCLTLDNQRLYFMWKRQVSPGEPGYEAEATYYFVERTINGWSEPRFAGQGMFLSSSRDGQIYTTDMSSRKKEGRTYLARVLTDNGVFTGYERLNINPRTGFQAHPCIAPDGSFIIFDVNGGAYMYISFKKSDGTWGEAIDLTENGFDPLAGGAYISPDGKFLFFALNGDIWWVDAKVVENLRPKE